MDENRMGYIINPPFSIKDRTFKPDPESTASAAYKAEGKLSASAANRTGSFIFRAKRITIYILRYIEPASTNFQHCRQSKLIARLKSSLQGGSKKPPILKDFSVLWCYDIQA